jgi:predicted nucleic acid-binding protein
MIDHSLLHGPKQVTDVYLLALAVKHGGRLVALDRAIPLAAARRAETKHLILL